MALVQESRTRIASSQATLEATFLTIFALQTVDAVTTRPIWPRRRRQLGLAAKSDGASD
jgi:hypothetical protein